MKRLLSLLSLLVISVLLFAEDFVVDGIKQELAFEFGKEILNYATIDARDFNGFTRYDIKVTVAVPENKRGVDTFDY